MWTFCISGNHAVPEPHSEARTRRSFVTWRTRRHLNLTLNRRLFPDRPDQTNGCRSYQAEGDDREGRYESPLRIRREDRASGRPG